MTSFLNEMQLFFRYNFTTPKQYNTYLLNQVCNDIILRFGRITLVWTGLVFLVVGIQFPVMFAIGLLYMLLCMVQILNEIELKIIIIGFFVYIVSMLYIVRTVRFPFLLFTASSVLPLVIISIFRDRTQINENAEENVV
jgi:hypothetical protein